MRKIPVFCFVFIFITGFCFAADPVEGFWLSIDDKTNEVTAGWHIYQESGKLYGKLLSYTADYPGIKASRCKDSYPGFPVAGKVSEMPVNGTPWIFGLTGDKPGEWSNGYVIDPSNGRMYKCKMFFHPAGSKVGRTTFQTDMLEMRGEIGLGIGGSQFWRKTNEATANSLWPKQ